MQNLKYSTEHGKCRSRGQAAADLSKHWCRSWHFSVFIGFLIWRPSALLRNTIHKQNVIVSTFFIIIVYPKNHHMGINNICGFKTWMVWNSSIGILWKFIQNWWFCIQYILHTVLYAVGLSLKMHFSNFGIREGVIREKKDFLWNHFIKWWPPPPCIGWRTISSEFFSSKSSSKMFVMTN